MFWTIRIELYKECHSMVILLWQECDPFYKMEPETVAREILASHDSDKVNTERVYCFWLTYWKKTGYGNCN